MLALISTTAAAIGAILNLLWSSNADVNGRGGMGVAHAGLTNLLFEDGHRDAHHPPQEEKNHRKVAVCFFGLTRSLRWTLPSIEKRLLGVLRDSGMKVEVFLHTYDLLEVNNERAGEVGIKYGRFKNDFRALNANRTSVTDQDLFDRAWPDPLSMTHYHWHYRKTEVHSVIRNVFRAYWSMSTVWSVMVQYAMETGTRYDAVVLARPDVWFHVDTDLPSRQFPLPAKTVFLPSFETDKGGGGRKNDRFAYGSMDSMGILMNRVATLTDPNGGRFEGIIDSEWVTGHHLMVNDITTLAPPRLDSGRFRS
eukprot:jgi/Undpi1/7612/HiC_scaffold_23.g10085.m1